MAGLIFVSPSFLATARSMSDGIGARMDWLPPTLIPPIFGYNGTVAVCLVDVKMGETRGRKHNAACEKYSKIDGKYPALDVKFSLR
jgi:hypothetical protein